MAAKDEINGKLDQIVEWLDGRVNQLAGFVRDVVNSKESLTPAELDAKLAAFAEGSKPSGQPLFKGDESPEVYAWDPSSGFRHIDQAEYLALITAGAVLKELPQAVIEASAVKSNG